MYEWEKKRSKAPTASVIWFDAMESFVKLFIARKANTKSHFERRISPSCRHSLLVKKKKKESSLSKSLGDRYRSSLFRLKLVSRLRIERWKAR